MCTLIIKVVFIVDTSQRQLSRDASSARRSQSPPTIQRPTGRRVVRSRRDSHAAHIAIMISPVLNDRHALVYPMGKVSWMYKGKRYSGKKISEDRNSIRARTTNDRVKIIHKKHHKCKCK